MSKVWKTARGDDVLAGRLVRELGIPAPLAALLVARGFSDAQSVDRFLNPRLSDISDPFLLPGMDKAVDRIWKAIDEKQPIVVFGDYDVDGITSTALMILSWIAWAPWPNRFFRIVLTMDMALRRRRWSAAWRSSGPRWW